MIDTPGAHKTPTHEKILKFRQEKRKRAGILMFVYILIFMIIFFFVYGFESRYYEESKNVLTRITIPQVFMSTVFTLLGFGFLLSSYKGTRIAGFGIALIVISFNYLIGPLLQELWFIALLKDKVPVDNAANFWAQGNLDLVAPSSITFKLANLCSVSYLIAMTGLVGRISISGIYLSIVLFNILWYLNLYLNILLSQTKNLKPLVYLDDYGTYFVYLFGAVYGLLCCLFNKVSHSENDQRRDKLSTVYHLIGSAFLFCTFSLTNFDIVGGTDVSSSNFRYSAGPSNILFSMIGSVLGIYFGSLIINKGRVGVREASFGVIVGAIMNGVGANFI